MAFTELIPIFPIPFVIFPGEQISLHVFEDKYKLLIADCLGTGEGASNFGILCALGGRIEAIGCSVNIERVLNEYSDGRYDIRIRGLIRYYMRSIDRSGHYPKALIEYFEDLELAPDHSLRSKAVSLHIKLVELASGNTLTPFFEASDRASFALGHGAGFDLAQRQKFLEMRTEKERLEFLISHYRHAIPLVQEKQELKDRVVANGHIRTFTSG